MLPAAAGYEVATPTVAQLVGDNVYILTVATDNGRGSEREDGVFHAYHSCKHTRTRIAASHPFHSPP